ncbi:MAG TPA: LacI family DNA-binding transcriptional regulator [Solirubrobacteraceae bacterium]|nr:LacI family DNA-binding transcriptional regulator [Solirubrobacteraceae bacterium]
MAVTSRDVAERAGVSQSTVSLVLSGKAAGRVSARTVAAVEAAARELGYRPNAAARTLRTGRTRALGLVVPDVTNPFFGLLLRGAQSAARRHGYTVALVDVERDPDARRSSLHALHSAAVDGYLTFEVDLGAVVPGWSEPTVAIEAWEGAAPKVRLDVEGGVQAAARHLLALGHARIGRLRSMHPAETFAARDRALAEVLGEIPTERAEHDIDDARRAALRLLAHGVTAVLCDDDVIAGGLYLAARETGTRIPADVSVVGFDDLDIARLVEPPLTTVAVHPEAFGAAAVERLLQEMEGEPGPDLIVAPTDLVVRESTGPPTARSPRSGGTTGRRRQP